MISKAKINLGLKVLHKRGDGFHDIESIFIKINFGDLLEFEPNRLNQIRLFSKNEIANSSHSEFELVSERGNFEKNILFKTYQKSKNVLTELPGVDIHLIKRIPAGGGLGGGSSNSAALLNYLFYNTEFDLSDSVFQIAKEIGSDVPFFILNDNFHVSGLGDILSPVSIPSGFGILVIPSVYIPTNEAYKSFKKTLQEPWGVKTWNLLNKDSIFHLAQGNWSFFKDKFSNDFEEFAFNSFPYLKELKEDLYKAGSEYASMSGSGSCFYGLVSDFDTCIEVQNFIQSKYIDHLVLQFSF